MIKVSVPGQVTQSGPSEVGQDRADTDPSDPPAASNLFEELLDSEISSESSIHR